MRIVFSNACEVFRIVLAFLECLINILLLSLSSSLLLQTNVLLPDMFVLLVRGEPRLLIIVPHRL